MSPWLYQLLLYGVSLLTLYGVYCLVRRRGAPSGPDRGDPGVEVAPRPPQGSDRKRAACYFCSAPLPGAGPCPTCGGDPEQGRKLKEVFHGVR